MAKNKFGGANIFGSNTMDDDPFKSFDESSFSAIAKEEKPVKTSVADNTDLFNGDIPVESANVLIPLEKLVPAPDDWNMYPPADADTIVKMMESFVQYGQLKVAIVRNEGDGTYKIIGGHNRFTVLQKLHELYPDVERYKTMRCNVYSKEAINDEAFQIAVIEDNEAQRAKEDSRYIAIGYNVRKKFGEKSSITRYGLSMRKQLREKYGISNGTASNIEQIGNYLLDDYLALYINGTLSRNDALAISKLQNELQKYLYDSGITKLSVSEKKGLAKCFTIDDIDNVLCSDKEYAFDGFKMSSPTPKDNISIKLPVPKKNIMEFLEKAMIVFDGMDIEASNKQYIKEVLDNYSKKYM